MAFNTFAKDIPKDGIYVYGLTDNGKVFYVGITKWVPIRYKQHFSELLCGNYIMHMRIKGEYPGLIIYGVFEILDQVESVEHSLIWHFSQNGNKLCNHHQNPIINKIDNIEYDRLIKVKRMPQNLHI